MSDKNTPELNTPEANAPEAGRRRILGAGLAAPVLMSVASSPVMANGLHICSPSGWASAGAITNAQHSSVIRHQKAECGAKSPGYWKSGSTKSSDPVRWPTYITSDGIAKKPAQVWDYATNQYVNGYMLQKTVNGVPRTSAAISYEDLFPGMGSTQLTSGKASGDYSHYPHWWLNNRGASTSRVVWYLTAARLNTLSGLASAAYANEAEVLQMWLQLVVQKKSTYSYGGVTLSANQVCDYLANAET